MRHKQGKNQETIEFLRQLNYDTIKNLETYRSILKMPNNYYKKIIPYNSDKINSIEQKLQMIVSKLFHANISKKIDINDDEIANIQKEFMEFDFAVSGFRILIIENLKIEDVVKNMDDLKKMFEFLKELKNPIIEKELIRKLNIQKNCNCIFTEFINSIKLCIDGILDEKNPNRGLMIANMNYVYFDIHDNVEMLCQKYGK